MAKNRWDEETLSVLLESFKGCELSFPEGLPQAILRRMDDCIEMLMAWLSDERAWNQGSWRPIHALHLLGASRRIESVPAILQATQWEGAAQWLGESFPDILAGFGADVLPYLKEHLKNAQGDSMARVAAAEALWRLGCLEPASRDEIQSCLSEQIEIEGDKEVVTAIILRLANLDDGAIAQQIAGVIKAKKVVERSYTQKEVKRLAKAKRGWQLSYPPKDPMAHFEPGNLAFMRELQSLTARGLRE